MTGEKRKEKTVIIEINDSRIGAWKRDVSYLSWDTERSRAERCESCWKGGNLRKTNSEGAVGNQSLAGRACGIGRDVLAVTCVVGQMDVDSGTRGRGRGG